MLKALVAFEGESSLFGMDAIEHEGQAWLVPEWLESPEEGFAMPARIVLIDNLQHQRLPAGSGAPYQFAVNVPIPRDVCEGRDPEPTKRGYVVVESPAGIRFPIPRGIH